MHHQQNSRALDEKAGRAEGLPAQDSIDARSDSRSKVAMTPSGADEANMISFEDQAGEIASTGPGNPRNSTRRHAQRTDGDEVEFGAINNIQVDTEGNLEVKRLSNSQHAMLAERVRGIEEGQRDKLVIDLQDKPIGPAAKNAAMLITANNPSQSLTRRKDRLATSSQNSSSLRMTPTSHSDLRFRQRRQNRRLIMVASGASS